MSDKLQLLVVMVTWSSSEFFGHWFYLFAVASPRGGLGWTCPVVHHTFARGHFWNWYKSDEFLQGGRGRSDLTRQSVPYALRSPCLSTPHILTWRRPCPFVLNEWKLAILNMVCRLFIESTSISVCTMLDRMPQCGCVQATWPPRIMPNDINKSGFSFCLW